MVTNKDRTDGTREPVDKEQGSSVFFDHILFFKNY
jgi:hypothetical protein